MSAYPDGCARMTDESLQIHRMPCDVFENSMNQRTGMIRKCWLR
jgi:hypothetical protein